MVILIVIKMIFSMKNRIENETGIFLNDEGGINGEEVDGGG